MDSGSLFEPSNVSKLKDMFSLNSHALQAIVSLAQRPWFTRVWIVQEVALASELRIRRRSAFISGDIFCTAIQMLRSVVTDPPTPWLSKPYQNAVKLDQPSRKVSVRQESSYRHLVQYITEWECTDVHDRLNALFGLVPQHTAS